MRAAMVGGTAYAAGRAGQRAAGREQSQDAQLEELEAQQQQQQAPPAPARDAIRDADGMLLADAWVHPADLVGIGLLAAEEAQTH